VPKLVLGDIEAQHAACRIGERALQRLVRRYGTETVRTYVRELIDYAERLTRSAIAAWPKGTFRFEDHIDSDGFDDTPIPIRVAITVREDSVLVDFTGSSPQVKGAINSTMSFTRSATYLSIRCALGRDVPNNAGVFRCIEVKAPQGSILNPHAPAPVAARALTGYRVVDAMFGALAQIVPERMPAAGEGGNTVVCIGGYDEQRAPFVVVDMINGAWGGRPDKDGIEGVTNPSQNMSNTPVEVLEARAPVLVETFGYLPDSCGAGRYRGGLGLVRQYRLLAHEAVLQLRADRHRFAPFGLAGGLPARCSRNLLNPDGEARELPAKVTMTIHAGDVIRHEQPGGGGHGDPALRDPAAIARDLEDGKITRDHATAFYGRRVA
jgi:N-methylhydantoinase B